MQKIIVRVVIVLIVLVVLTASFFSFMYYSEGERVGNLVKFSRKGYVFKTWEGQINTGVSGVDATQPLSTAWSFTVVDRDVIEKLREVEGKKVKLHYVEKYFVYVWQGDTKYFIKSVEVLN